MSEPLLAAWKDYKEQVYREGMSADQHQQVKNAFYAGALVAVVLITHGGEGGHSEEDWNSLMDELSNYEGAGDSKDN